MYQVCYIVTLLVEFIFSGFKAQHEKLSFHFPVSILGTLFHAVDIVQNLAVCFNDNFSFSEHVQKSCKPSFLQMHDNSQITQYLTH